MANKKKTTEQFIAEAKEVWEDRWDYSKTEYVRASDKVIITCLEHGDFSQAPHKHLQGKTGCRECFKRNQAKRLARTQEDFESEVRQLWGDRWDLSEAVYTNARNKVTLKCREHGYFEQTPVQILGGHVGCGSCNNREVSTEEFVSKAKEVWGDRLDFSKVKYTNTISEVTLICPHHGEFTQRASSVLKGYLGCAYCNGKSRSTSQAISALQEVWGDRWDLSKAEYAGRKKRITLICREHGEFSQTYEGAIVGKNGCPDCNGQTITQEDFLRMAQTMWGDKYQYDKSLYINAVTPVTISCMKHGDFAQAPYSHLRGFEGCVGCRSTGTSAGENEVREFLLSNDIQCHKKYLPNGSGKGIEIDMLDETRGVGVEFNGIYWHSERFKDKNFHKNKSEVAASNGIRLLHIWEDEWMFKKDIVKEHILRVFGVSKQRRIPARKIEVREITGEESSKFLNKYHIQGRVNATVYVGGFFEGTLVAVAGFKRRKEDYELVRYATSDIVQGGHSKLVSFFEKSHTYRNLVTFADLSFSDGGLYESTGWVMDRVLEPDYKYLVGYTREHKFNYRIKRFKNDPALEYRDGLTEQELAKLNGLLRIYDAGKIRFIKPHP